MDLSRGERPEHSQDRRALVALGWVGLSGPLLMFAGDLLLYFQATSSEEFGQRIFEIIRDHDFSRVALGGILGPVAAVLYMAAFLLAVLLIDGRHPRSRIGIFSLFAFMMAIGGAYHAQFPLLGFHVDAVQAGILPPSETFPGVAEQPAQYALLLLFSYLGLGALAWGWFGILVAAGRTALPRWSVLLTPFLFFWFSDLGALLPQPLNVIVIGGWFNLCYLPLFSMLIWVARRRSRAA
ncbi:MAG: DUF6796 family protein [Acidobacteriota bacterium]